jgi:hypothetical protein
MRENPFYSSRTHVEHCHLGGNNQFALGGKLLSFREWMSHSKNAQMFMKPSALLLQNFFQKQNVQNGAVGHQENIELHHSAIHKTSGYTPSILDSEVRKAAPVAMAIRFRSAFLHLLTAMAPASTKYYKHQTNKHLNEKHKYKRFKLSTFIIAVSDIIKQTHVYMKEFLHYAYIS